MRSGGDAPSRFALTAGSGRECAEGVGVIYRTLTWVRQHKTQFMHCAMLAEIDNRICLVHPKVTSAENIAESTKRPHSLPNRVRLVASA